MIVIYHGGCFDGFTAAWTHWYFAPRDDAAPSAYHPARYGDEPPWDLCTGEDVLIVDFSYPRPLLERLREVARSLIILDHHQTAAAALKGFPGATFDMAHAGCVLMWQHLGSLHPWIAKREVPALLRYIEDRDLWTFALPGSREVAAVVSSTEMTYDGWTELYRWMKEDESSLLDRGDAILRYMKQYGTKALEESRLEVIGNYTVPTVNLPYMNCSEYVGRLLEQSPPFTPFAAGYFRRRDGLWQFSLRSKAPFDVSRVAQAYGGGGHAQAAGFQVSVLPWEQNPMMLDGEERRVL